MTDFLRIYAEEAKAYERMTEAEDVDGRLPRALAEIRPWAGQTVVEFGAGTGRLTAMMAPQARSIFSCDRSPQMLAVAAKKMRPLRRRNWMLAVADNFALPVADNSADIAIEGWSFGHYIGWRLPDWQPALQQLLAEMNRVTRPGGTQILLETLGTGHEEPHIIFPEFGDFMEWLVREQGFTRRWIRTDFLFASPEDAAARTRFFFGDELADRLLREQTARLPECTGIWHRTYRAETVEDGGKGIE